MENYIYEFVLNKKKQRVGVVVATVVANNPESVRLGFSRCNTSAGDKFDKGKALTIALGRARAGGTMDLPISMLQNYMRMADRAKRYFKDKSLSGAFVSTAPTAIYRVE